MPKEGPIGRGATKPIVKDVRCSWNRQVKPICCCWHTLVDSATSTTGHAQCIRSPHDIWEYPKCGNNKALHDTILEHASEPKIWSFVGPVLATFPSPSLDRWHRSAPSLELQLPSDMISKILEGTNPLQTVGKVVVQWRLIPGDFWCQRLRITTELQNHYGLHISGDLQKTSLGHINFVRVMFVHSFGAPLTPPSQTMKWRSSSCICNKKGPDT